MTTGQGSSRALARARPTRTLEPRSAGAQAGDSLSGMTPEPVAAVAATVDPVLSLLIGALGAAVLTVIGGFIGSLLQSRREHARWIREARLEAYRDFLRIAERMPEITSKEMTEREERYIDEMKDSLATVKLLGPDTVRIAAVKYMAAAVERSSAFVKHHKGSDAYRAAERDYVLTQTALIAVARTKLKITS